jgi:predicted dinucleotide-binding enzyme
MNKNLIKVLAVIFIISPFVAVPNIYKEVFYVLGGVILVLATVDISKKKDSNVL